MKNRPSLRDLARAAGLSHTAVVHALRNSSKVSEATRERVHRLADEIGYQPDAEVRRLMTAVRSAKGREEMPTIALLTTYRHDSEWASDAGYKRFLSIVTKRAEKLGFRLECFNLYAPGMTPRRMRTAFLTRRIEVLIVGPAVWDKRPLDFDFSGFAAAMCSSPDSRVQLPRCEPDYFGNMALAVERLHERGYRRLGLAQFGDMAQRSSYRLEAACKIFCERHPEHVPVPAYSSSTFDLEPVADWLEREKPDCVISDFLKVPPWLRTLGFKLPRDIGFASLLATDPAWNLSGINPRPDLVDAGVVDLAISLLYSGHRGESPLAQRVSFPGEWVDGNTARSATTGEL